MTLHACIAYLRYRRRALGRHGTHSPFVYEFVERVVQGPLPAQSNGDRYQQLLAAMRSYYNCDITVIDAAPLTWPQSLDRELQLLVDGFIAVRHIHATPEHTAAWNALCADARVLMSMDLYGMGLLLSRPGFKVKQHFVVLY